MKWKKIEFIKWKLHGYMLQLKVYCSVISTSSQKLCGWLVQSSFSNQTKSLINLKEKEFRNPKVKQFMAPIKSKIYFIINYLIAKTSSLVGGKCLKERTFDNDSSAACAAHKCVTNFHILSSRKTQQRQRLNKRHQFKNETKSEKKDLKTQIAQPHH